MSEIPPEMERTIVEHEERVTQQLRAALGRDDVVAVFDRTPILLSPEKRWPEDFRGFGTNVRPKKQK